MCSCCTYLSRLLPTTTSFKCTMFSCRQLNKTWISRRPLTGIPSLSKSILTFFNATIFSETVSFARSKKKNCQLFSNKFSNYILQTIPYVPSPILFNFSNSDTNLQRPSWEIIISFIGQQSREKSHLPHQCLVYSLVFLTRMRSKYLFL